MSDVIVVMCDGRIQQQGEPTELYERPVNRFVAAFIGTSNFLPASVVSIDTATRRVGVHTDLGLDLRGRLTDHNATVSVGDAVTVALIVRRQNATGAQASLGLGPGDPVTLTWQEEANLVLAD
jgi:ABC-type Fe3+/spermidine/putrescine transport system ATPase subunit